MTSKHHWIRYHTLFEVIFYLNLSTLLTLLNMLGFLILKQQIVYLSWMWSIIPLTLFFYHISICITLWLKSWHIIRLPYPILFVIHVALNLLFLHYNTFCSSHLSLSLGHPILEHSLSFTLFIGVTCLFWGWLGGWSDIS